MSYEVQQIYKEVIQWHKDMLEFESSTKEAILKCFTEIETLKDSIKKLEAKLEKHARHSRS